MEEQVLLRMVKYFGDDIRRIAHAFKVSGFAKAIMAGEGITGENKLVTGLAAILHDIGIKEAERKYHSTAGHYQEMEGPPIARQMMEQCRVNPDLSERVCFLVGNHHSYQKIDGVDFQILVEADLLVNIQEGDIKPESVPAVIGKYFKTKTGAGLANLIFPF